MKIPAYQAWMERAACRTEDPALFYGYEGERTASKNARVAEAKRICRGCPVLASCAQYTVDHETPSSRWGVWAGMTADERIKRDGLLTSTERSRLSTRRRDERQHGTTKGYRQHRLHDEEVCAECRAAYSEYQMTNRARQRREEAS